MRTAHSRHRRLALVVGAIAAAGAIAASAITAVAIVGAPRRSLAGAAGAVSAPLSYTTACSSAAGCDLYAKPGTVTAGATSGIPIWGFTMDNADPAGGRLGGDVKNTIVINQTDTLKIVLHNSLPAGTGNVALEFPAVGGVPDATGATTGGTTTYTISGLSPGTYVYQAGATAQQDRQIAMGLAAIIIVRPTGYLPATPRAFGTGDDAFAEEAVVAFNEIDPAFNNAENASPGTADVENCATTVCNGYSPKFFFINGKAAPAVNSIGVNSGDQLLLRVANLGIRDRALGLLNARLTVLADDSHKYAADSHRPDIESKLLTPGAVADLRTMVVAPIGSRFALLDLSRNLVNGAEAGAGGMLGFIDVVGTPPPSTAMLVRVNSLTPATNDGSAGNNMTIGLTFSGGATSAKWFLDKVTGTCASGGHPLTTAASQTINIADVLGDGATTGQHVIWVLPCAGTTGGTPAGDVFSLALKGPNVYGLTTDPSFTNLSTAINKVDPNPPGSTNVQLVGSVVPSLLDYAVDAVKACLTLPAPTGDCGAGDVNAIPVLVDPATAPSHVQHVHVSLPASTFTAGGDGPRTLYLRAHEMPSGSGSPRWSDWGQSANAQVSLVVDRSGPTTTYDMVKTLPNPAGIGNHPGNLNFLESVRIQVDLSDTLSPISDAELFLDYDPATDPTNAPTGTGAQLRPLAGQWADDVNVHTRTAYIEVPVSELQSRPQGSVKVYIHAKDAAGNWGPSQLLNLGLDKTNPIMQPVVGTTMGVDVAGSHTYQPDETGAPALAGGRIRIKACDPNGVTLVGPCPSPAPAQPTAVTSNVVEVRYHVNAGTGTVGLPGAGIFYQSAQRVIITQSMVGVSPVLPSNGPMTIEFTWNTIPQPPLPIDPAISVFVWVVDGAGNASAPIEVVLGP